MQIFTTYILLGSLFVTACAVKGPVPTGYSSKGGKEKVVAKSGPRPSWAFNRPMFFQNGNFYASGMFTDAPNLGKGLDIAAKLAQAKLAESIKLDIEESFNYASKGIEIQETAIDHIVSAVTGSIAIRGMAHNKYYYEKKQLGGPLGAEYRYDCFALVEVSYDSYKKAIVSEAKRALPPSTAEQVLEKINERQRDVYGIPEVPPTLKEEDLKN